jgi:hypothetical protein
VAVSFVARTWYMKKTSKRWNVQFAMSHHSHVECRNGHFVCDECHRLSANDLVESFCVNSNSKEPMELATVLMNSPKLQMHGPEHHFLVPAVLLTTYYNIKGDRKEKIRKRECDPRTFWGDSAVFTETVGLPLERAFL